jgi:GNAT superfamily N-acetyltransferase
MRILLDTNIFIPLEDSSQVLDESLSDLVKLANQHGHSLLIHPASREDIERDSNLQRKEISLSRIDKYPKLEFPPVLSEEELRELGLAQNKDNDRIDNLILYALYRDTVELLVTEDRGMHKKAIQLGLTDRIHYIQQASELLRKLHTKERVTLPSIKDVPTHCLDLKDPFFDSLREGYPDFNKWFTEKCCRGGRHAWIYFDGHEHPRAICIYNEEESPIISDDFQALQGKVLKLCTFKVGEEVRGRKIGELLLKAAFQYATRNNIEHIYLTMKLDKQPYLRDMVEEYGFSYFSDHNGDQVFVKKHPVNPPDNSLSPLDYHIQFFPHFKSGDGVNKFIIPVQPKFHATLFPEIQAQLGLFLHASVGNAIKQAYLCNARIKSPSVGDIVLFYRSEDLKAVTSLGVIESVHDLDDVDKIVPLVSKRTVYSFDDIAKMAEKRTKVILFRSAMHFKRPVTYKWLTEEGVINGQIQTIRQISDVSFRQIMDE